MKKVLGLTGTIATGLALVPQAFADSTVNSNLNPCPTGGQFDALCNVSNLGAVIGFVITIAFVIAILIALGFLVWGGIKWITSGGDKTAVEGARNHIIAAIIGLIIVFLAFFILNLVLGLFGLSLLNLKLPSFPTQ